jgi:uncharacterized membrane protein YphA (DoxX/SURF4 family)
MTIYVETAIRGTMDEVWRLTQTPDLHARWDLRFTDITYLPRADASQPQRFRYATRIGFGLAIEGQGETVGRHDGNGGECTSALKFWSDDPRSLIRKGAGYWRYVPTPNGLRFLTAYDYHVGFGRCGRLLDVLVFRPLLGWATAWSFDRLRLWIEQGIDPAVSLQRALIHGVARAALAFVWCYQGIVPKLLGPHFDELAVIQQGGVSAAAAPLVAQAIGWGEAVFGLAMVVGFHQRWHFLLTILLMIAATISVTIRSPQFLIAAFNPVSLNVLMIALALVGLLAGRDVPSARRCLRTQPKGKS